MTFESEPTPSPTIADPVRDPAPQWIRDNAHDLGQVRDLAPLIDKIKGARVVMLGEASHGTHEFYEWRRLISEWLIAKHGFDFIVVEGDWPSCQAVDRYIKGFDLTPDARTALGAFRRWPTWMWANTEIVRLAEWLRTHNAAAARGAPVGFHGLDVYSLFESMQVVVERLEAINPFLARRARARYSCFDSFWEDEWRYARSLLESAEGCEQEVVSTLRDLLALRLRPEKPGTRAEEWLFDARQNARVVANAEHYYRSLTHGREDSWNIRDRHMLETLEVLLSKYDERRGRQAKAIVWAHNTHIGDHRATDMVARGQINIGGLARERWGSDPSSQVALIGFGTHQGSVTASHAWDGPIETLETPVAKAGSYEDAFHKALSERGSKQAWFWFDAKDREKHAPMTQVRGHRAIGVVYDPKHERFGNYVPTSLAKRYDGFIFIDQTKAIDPLIQGYDRSEIPETYPAGQ
jgi:erythromycin esterase